MKTNIILLYITLFLITPTLSECDKGCQKCNKPDATCLVCDTSSYFTLKKGKCIQNIVPNCKIYDDGDGSCSMCKDGFFLEKYMKKCISLDYGTLVENCQSYLTLGECVKCKTLFFIEANVCRDVSKKIDNCLYYKGPSNCDECESGFLLDLKKVNCFALDTKDANCVTQTTVKCLGCNGEAIADLNYLKKEIDKDLKSVDPNIHALANQAFLNASLEYEEGCVIGQIENCASYNSSDICGACKDGYFLNDNKCYLFPKEKIANCAKYLTETECAECFHFFYLKSNINCSPITEIKNCELYSTTADETICVQCWESHFLSTNTCQERENLSDNCSNYSKTLDICLSCFGDKVVTSDGKKCLAKVENCELYLESTLETTTLTCQQCASHYYLDPTVCKLGSILNCKTYAQSSNTCNECEDTFYLKTNSCFKHSDIKDCKIYDKNSENKCLECENNTVLMSKTTNCKKVFIEGCQTYSNMSLCLSCEDGFDKINNYECIKLEPFLNCIRAVNGVCEKCEKNFLLKGGACTRPYNYEVKYCAKTNITGDFNDHELVNCEVCLPDALPLNYKNHFVCVENSEMEILRGTYLIPSCLGYQKDGASAYKCVKCEENFVLKDGLCKNNCDTEIIQRYNFVDDSTEFSFEKKDFCVTKTPTECELKTIGTIDNVALSSHCLKSANTHFQKVTLGDNKEIYAEAKDINDNITSKNIFSLPMTENIANNDVVKKKGILNSDGLVEDCKYYYELEDSNIGCSVCKFAKYGRIINWGVDFCNEYSVPNKNCTKCVHGYYDAVQDGENCTKINIPGCLRFSLTEQKCLLCSPGWYLGINQATCTKRTLIDDCEYYSQTSNKCQKCFIGFKLMDLTPETVATVNNCQLFIPDCHIDSQNAAGNIQCDECINYYYPNADASKCLKGTVDRCWKYVQDININGGYTINTCDKYINEFLFKRKNECFLTGSHPLVNLIQGCLTYDYIISSTMNFCTVCDSETHFLTESYCCPYGQHLNSSGSCVNNGVTNCKINKNKGDSTICDVCDDGYEYFDDATKKCCKNGSFNNAGTCADKVNLDLNSECDIFDQETKYCLVCNGTKYKNNLFDEKCCASGTYYDSNGDCVTIPITGCAQYNTNDNCTKCTTSTFNPPNCCDTLSHYDDGDSCVTLPANCTEVEKVDNNWRCKVCAATHYFVPPSYICCTKGVSGTNASYDNGDGTCTIDATMSSCEEFSSDGKCIKCIAAETVFNDGTECCPDAQYWDSSIGTPACAAEPDNLLIFENCIQIDGNDPNKCKTCTSKYYLNNSNCVIEGNYWNVSITPQASAAIEVTIKNCNKINDDKTECIECLANHYLTTTATICCPPNSILDGTDCISIQEFSLNCAYFDLTTKRCAIIESEVQCAGSGDTRFYLDQTAAFNTQRRCCKEGEYYDVSDNLCKEKSPATNCLRPKVLDGSTCISCADGFTLAASGDVCTGTPVAGCANQSSDTLCSECKSEFLLDSGTAGACVAYVPAGVDFTKYCSTVLPTTITTCSACSDFAYINNLPAVANNLCCPLGYYFNTVIEQCKKISNQYCAKSVDGVNCTECFISKDHCTVSSNFNWTISNSDYSLVYTKVVGWKNLADADLPTNSYLVAYTENYLGTDTKKCCPLGKYYNSTSEICEDLINLGIKNCLEYNGSECKRCVDEYELSSNNCCRYDEKYDAFYKNCVKDFSVVTCKTGSYSSNGKCCLEHFFYDTNLSKCLPLFDPNCLQSDSRTDCKLCADNYQVEPNFGTLVKQDLRNPEHCQNLQEKHKVRFCKPDDWFADNIVDYSKLTVLIDDCNNFNFTNKNCDVCNTGSSKTDGNYCCPEFFFAYEEKCREMENFILNCYNYDHDKRKCTQCKNSYDLYEGVCCPQDKFLNIKTFKCDIEKTTCKIFDIKNGVCTQCNDNYYFSNYNCCSFGTYYDIHKKSCETIEGSDLTDCKRLGNDDTCDECFSNTYRHKGFCCPLGQYYNDTGTVSTSSCKESTDIFNCDKFDLFDKCLECKIGNYFSNFECCPEGQWYDWYDHNTDGTQTGSKSCITKPKLLDCKKISNDGTKCLECTSDYLTYDHCCAAGKVWSSTENLCLTILTNPHCLKLNATDNSKCVKCNSNYYLSNHKCCKDGYYYDSDHCSNIESSSTITVNNVSRYGSAIIKCVDTYILNNVGNACESYTIGVDAENCSKKGASAGLCAECDDNYYKSNDKCCQDGNFWDENLEIPACVSITTSTLDPDQVKFCAQIAVSNTPCTKCLNTSTHYVSSGECVTYGNFFGTSETAFSTSANCSEGPDDVAANCTACLKDFLFTSGTGCAAHTIATPSTDSLVPEYLKFCSYAPNSISANFPTSCLTCFPTTVGGSDRYLTQGSCCVEGEFFDNTNSFTCIPIDPSENFDNCTKINKSVCEKCESSFYLTNGHCCKNGFSWATYNGFAACVAIVGEGLAQCLKLDTNNSCNATAGCLVPDTHYITEYHCCLNTQYWNVNHSGGPQCDLIQLTGCKKVEATNTLKCSECVNPAHYLSNGNCCADATYYPEGANSCKAITNRGACDRISSNECQISTACGTPNPDHPECCTGFYFSSNSTCLTIGSCSKIKATGECTECTTGYLTNGKCCPELQFWNGLACTVFNNITNCTRVVDFDTSTQLLPSVCSKCSTGEVRNGNCCLESEYYLTSASECVPMDLFYTKCLSINLNGDCTNCITGNYPSNGVCCPEGKFYNTSGKICDTITTDNCLEQSASNCTKCESLFYLNTIITKCCKISFPHTSGLICDTANSINNCNAFDENMKCTSCATGNVLYPTGTGDFICCSDGEFYNGKTCQSLIKATERCSEFDQTTMKCKICNSAYFLGNDFCCLKDTHYWNITDKNCVTKTLDNCKKQVQLEVLNGENTNHCIECAVGAFYLLNDGCCTINNYWDNEKYICKPIPILNCQEYNPKLNGNTGACIDCKSGYNYYLPNKKCCPNGLWWNNYNLSCEQTINNCKIFEDINTPNDFSGESNAQDYLKKTLKCLECASGYLLSVDKKSCCVSNQVYFPTTNFDEQCLTYPLVTDVFENCIKFNIQAPTTLRLQCEKCKDTHYVSHGICCQKGELRDTTTKLCKTIPSIPFTDCDQVSDADLTVCTGCSGGKFINSTVTACLDFPNCKTFDNVTTNLCTVCDLSYYTSDGYCCEEGKKNNGSNSGCVAVGSKCLQFNNSECLKCDDFTYPIMKTTDITKINFCCSKGSYCADNSTTVAGEIANCEVYGESTTDCLKCDQNYAVTDLLNSVKYCYPVFIEHCKYQKITVNSNKNNLICEECEDQYFFDSSSDQDVIQSYNDQIDDCVGYNNTEYLNTSTLKCEECGNNKFLNNSDLNNLSCQTRINSGVNIGSNSSTWTNCKEPYVFNEDKCRVCEDGFYLYEATKLCKPYNDDSDGCLFKVKNDHCDVCGVLNYENYSYVEATTTPVLAAHWTKTCPLISTFTNENIIQSTPIFFKSFIESCIVNEECLPDYLNGLSVELQKYFSCHKCSDDTKIPFVSIQGGVETDANNGLQRYNILTSGASPLNTYNENEINYSSQCLKNDLTDFEFKSTASTTFPANCGLGMVNGELQANDTDSGNSNPGTGLSVYCAACKPGYAPSYSNKIFHVYQCAQISSCDVKGGAFNQCDECASTHAFEYIATGINYGKCVSNASITNCFAYNTVTNSCEYCKKGYSKNKEEKCEIINAPNCMENKMAFNKSYPFKDIKIAILMGDFGCSKCSENFSGLYKSQDEYVCTESSYIKAKSYVTSNPVFDINCLQYSNNNDTITCHKCSTTTVLATDGKCYLATNLTNCILAVSGSACQTCISSHVVVGDVCIEKEIKNCSIYTQPSAEQTCNTCEEKHYLLDNKCLEGSIKNCKVYGSNGTFCNTCDDGYERILVKDNAHYCIPITSHDNCLNFDTSNFQNHFLTCQECGTDYLLENLSSQEYVCNSYSLVTHCKSYDHGLNFGTSTFICNECINGYYLVEGECILRTVEINFCLVYEISQQLCKECEKEYYSKVDKTECLINPAGVEGCAIFLNENKCIKCKVGYYLEEENVCKAILTDNLIEGCINYSDNKACSECETGKILNTETNKCDTPDIPNCLVFKDLTNCETCKSGYGILQTAGNQKCEVITEVENCVIYKSDTPFPCSECKNNFYLLDSKCIEANPLIENCLNYETNELCSKCTDLHVLSPDKKKCTLHPFTGNCVSFQEENTPFCILCKPGYLLDKERKCEIDSTFNLKSNCLFFNRTSTNDCEMCQLGYYQNDKGECIANDFDKNKNITDAKDDDKGEVPIDGQNGIGLMSFRYLWFMVLIFVKFD